MISVSISFPSKINSAICCAKCVIAVKTVFFVPHIRRVINTLHKNNSKPNKTKQNNRIHNTNPFKYINNNNNNTINIIMSDNKLRCALIYRIGGGGDAVCVAKFDYAGQYETHGGAESSLYGGKDKSYAAAVAGVVSNDPPSGLSQPGTLGGFKVVQSDQHQIVYGADVDGLCVATITGTQYPSRVAITMLTDLYTTFSAKHGDAAKTAAENSLSKKAKKVLEDSCKKFADPSSVDKAQQVLGQVDAVKGQMQDNIASMLKNTEKADDMAAKSEQLNEQASVFKKRSTDLKKQMQWKNLKMTIILGAVILVIVLAVVVPLVLKAKRLAGK